MKRTDITQLFPDAPKETIDKLMDLNGADVNAVKAEVENLKAQLAEAQKNKDGEELQKAQQQITQLQTELDGMKAAETIRLTREKVAGEKKVPAHLLTGETEEACEKQADQILAYVQSSKAYSSTRQQFAEWAKENL